MRNYIILNGTNSNTINGLLIQELAPISKPLMRTEIEEIDGRDGDIITPLGFSAYDKEITIGLYGSYDINEIIAFFNSEGTVIFSNEPDKYYNYTIYQQIDFERLVRFRTATVTLHCQPFKFATTGETQTLDSGDPVSDEGTNLVLEGSQLAPFSQFDLKGNTVQDGTPTPSSPVPVQVVTGENTVKIHGKNLVGFAVGSASSNGITATYYSDGSIVLNGTATSNSFVRYDLIQPITVTAGQNYTLSANNTSTIGSASKYASVRLNTGAGDDTGTESFLYNLNATNTFSKTTDTTYYRLTIRTASGLSYDNFVIKPMLELGSTATAYEPYQEQSYEVNLGNIELCKIGTYQDYIWKDGDTWKVHKAIGKYVYNNDLSGNGITATRVDMLTPALPVAPDSTTTGTTASNMYQNSIVNNTGLGGTTALSCIRIMTSIDFADSYNAVKALAAANNLTIYYQSNAPTDTTITNTALIEQLDAIANQAHAYKPRTYIDSNAATGNVPHIIAATVVGSADGTVTNAGNIYSKPKLTIYGSGDVGVYLNGVQMLQIALGTLGNITIDTDLMEAYTGTIDNLQNRAVTGDYSNFKLAVGANKISFSGSVTSCTIENFSRWL